MAHFIENLPVELRQLPPREAVERYRGGANILGFSIEGLHREQLLATPVPGSWSIQQIVLHLVDSDTVAAYRMKRIVAEDEPLLDAYDETHFAERLNYHSQDPWQAAEFFRLNRLMTARVLEQLEESDFDRRACHPEIGYLCLADLVRMNVHHLDHHMGFVLRKREILLR